MLKVFTFPAVCLHFIYVLLDDVLHYVFVMIEVLTTVLLSAECLPFHRFQLFDFQKYPQLMSKSKMNVITEG